MVFANACGVMCFFEVPRDFVAASAPATLGYVWLPASGPASKQFDAFTLGPVATHHRPISIYILYTRTIQYSTYTDYMTHNI